MFACVKWSVLCATIPTILWLPSMPSFLLLLTTTLLDHLASMTTLAMPRLLIILKTPPLAHLTKSLFTVFRPTTPVGGKTIVLSKGLKFIPLKLSINKYILHDCQRFFRSLRWIWQSLGPTRQIKPANDITTTLFHAPIRREPPHGTYAEVEYYTHKCLTETRNLKCTPLKRSNLTLEESRSLTNLQKRDDIVIKPQIRW